MKNKLTKVILTTLLVASSLVAGSNDNTRSLVGVEAGYSSMDVNRDGTGTVISSDKSYNMYHGGVKIGAQTNDFRLFLSARYFGASDFDYVTTYGAELQYLIAISPTLNFYLGANAGKVNIKYSPDNEASRTASDTYYGGDAGVNVHLNESIDLEFGARVMMLDISNEIDSVTYTFDTMISGYVGVIYKFQMD